MFTPKMSEWCFCLFPFSFHLSLIPYFFPSLIFPLLPFSSSSFPFLHSSYICFVSSYTCITLVLFKSSWEQLGRTQTAKQDALCSAPKILYLFLCRAPRSPAVGKPLVSCLLPFSTGYGLSHLVLVIRKKESEQR